MNLTLIAPGILVATALFACAPQADWREFSPTGSNVVATFPCKPSQQDRSVAIAGAVANMSLLSCSVGGLTFALGFFDVVDPSRVTDAMIKLRRATVANLEGVNVRMESFQVRGMTPNPQALQLSLVGKQADGRVVRAHAAFFVKGMRVYQATVMGSEAPDAVQTFFRGFKFLT